MIEILMYETPPTTWASCNELAVKYGGDWGNLGVRQVVRRLAKIYSEDEYHDIVPDLAYMNIVARLNGVARRYQVKPSLYFRITSFSGSLERGTWHTVTAGDRDAAGNYSGGTTAKRQAQSWMASRRASFDEGDTIEITLARDGGGVASCTVLREHGIKIQAVSPPIARYAVECDQTA